MVNQNNSTSAAQNQPDSDNKNLMSIAQYLKDVQAGHKRSIPPLEQWQPKHCGKMDLIVKANGEWWHEGQLIKRQALLDLFTKVLWKEDGKFYLKTPVEQIEIQVEDEPLLVNQVDQVNLDGQVYLQVTTTNQDITLIDPEHPIFMREYQGELRPYVHIRFGDKCLDSTFCFFSSD